MRRIIVFCVIISICLLTAAAEVKNSDHPLKGKWDFAMKKVWQIESAGEELLVEVTRIRVDQKGDIYLLDSKFNRIHVLDNTSRLRFSFGKKGEGPGEIKYAFNFFFGQDQVIVPEMGKIHFFAKNGKYSHSNSHNKNIFPMGFLDSERLIGSPFSMSAEQQKVRKIVIFNIKTGEEKLLLNVPPAKALRFESDGMGIMIRMPQATADSILYLHDNLVYYGFSDTYRIKRLDLSGKADLEFSLLGRPTQKIAAESKLALFKRTLPRVTSLPQKAVKDMAKQIPDQMPHFNRFHVDKKGHIYVFIPNLLHPNMQKMDIFSKEGKYIYSGVFQLEQDFTFKQFAIHGNELYLFLEDDEGERLLAKYLIKLPS